MTRRRGGSGEWETYANPKGLMTSAAGMWQMSPISNAPSSCVFEKSLGDEWETAGESKRHFMRQMHETLLSLVVSFSFFVGASFFFISSVWGDRGFGQFGVVRGWSFGGLLEVEMERIAMYQWWNIDVLLLIVVHYLFFDFSEKYWCICTSESKCSIFVTLVFMRRKITLLIIEDFNWLILRAISWCA